ncbi:prolyl oligopeptidase family serine peptidase [Ekhidna sp.]|uniref:alpha/beta hydrolase family protein n=1 Tax=Ekhidna sp. TaxID=2608089 RepID=UPI00329A223C
MKNRILQYMMVMAAFVVASCSDDEPRPQGEFIPIVSGDITLAAELDVPVGAGPHPALIMIHGSGEQDRHIYAGAANNYLRVGIAVLRYDKRGVGQSTGQYLDVNTENSTEVFPILADDIVAIANFLANHPEIDAERIGLLGPSQAGWIMPLAAVNTSLISYMVSISGATSSVGISDFYDVIAELSLSDQEIADALADYDGVQGYDPRADLELLDIPALWIYGGKDKSNPTANDVMIIDLVKTEFDKDYTVHLFPNLNHDLVDVNTNQTILDTQLCLNDWLNEKLGL